jgi:hypothetical protein
MALKADGYSPALTPCRRVRQARALFHLAGDDAALAHGLAYLNPGDIGTARYRLSR